MTRVLFPCRRKHLKLKKKTLMLTWTSSLIITVGFCKLSDTVFLCSDVFTYFRNRMLQKWKSEITAEDKWQEMGWRRPWRLRTVTDVDPPSQLSWPCSEQEGGREGQLTFSFSGIQYTVGTSFQTPGEMEECPVLKLLQEGNFLVVQWLGLALPLARPWFNPW